MNKWERVKLKDVLLKSFSGEWGNEPTEESPYLAKVVRTGDFNNDGTLDYSKLVLREITKKRIDEKQLKNGDIILEKSGGSDKQPVGRVVLFENCESSEVFLCNNFTMILRSKSNVNSKFVLYYLHYWYLLGATRPYYNQTTGLQNLQVKRFLEQKIPLPPLPIQKQIASVLDTATQVVEHHKTILNELDALAQSVFYQMFGDPVTNEMGWEIEKLKNVADVRDGTHDSPTYVENGFPLLTSKNFSQGYINMENINYITKEDYDKINQRSKVHKGDIIMPMIGTIGSPVIVDVEPNFAIKNVALVKTKSVFAVYIINLIKSPLFERYIYSYSRGGTQKFISLTNLRSFYFPLPPLPLQQEFATIIEKIEEQKKQVQRGLTESKALLDSLMNQYFGN